MNRTAGTTGYAPRNALNADRLKAGIAARSDARGDAAPVRAWLLNHFYRHLVANFEPARTIASLDEARKALGAATLPDWVAARFSAAKTASGSGATSLAPVVWIDPNAPELLALEQRLLEFLTSRQGTALEGKLERINCPQALAQWEREHAEMAVRVERGWRESQPDALLARLTTPNGSFVEFRHDSALLRAEMAFESYVMRHCLGQFADRRALSGGYGERYAEAIEQQRLRLLSFRDARGQPHITISLLVGPDGTLTVDQVKGKQNRPPIDRYVGDVLACFNALAPGGDTPADCIAIGVVRTPAGWQRIEEVTDAATQTRLVAQYPQLFPRLRAPSPMVEWLIAARQPALLAEHLPRAASVAYATRHARTKRGAGTPLPNPAASFVTEDVPWPEMSAEQAHALVTHAGPHAG